MRIPKWDYGFWLLVLCVIGPIFVTVIVGIVAVAQIGCRGMAMAFPNLLVRSRHSRQSMIEGAKTMPCQSED